MLLVDLHEEALKETADALENKNVSWCAADVSKAAYVIRYTKQATDSFGKVDIFFNNAGIEAL